MESRALTVSEGARGFCEFCERKYQGVCRYGEEYQERAAGEGICHLAIVNVAQRDVKLIMRREGIEILDIPYTREDIIKRGIKEVVLHHLLGQL